MRVWNIRTYRFYFRRGNASCTTFYCWGEFIIRQWITLSGRVWRWFAVEGVVYIELENRSGIVRFHFDLEYVCCSDWWCGFWQVAHFAPSTLIHKKGVKQLFISSYCSSNQRTAGAEESTGAVSRCLTATDRSVHRCSQQHFGQMAVYSKWKPVEELLSNADVFC
jgi:hypothetical protein